jgi:hypothetical protein
LYLFSILIFNLSLLFMFLYSPISKYFIFTYLAISLLYSFLSGVWVGTPYEMFLGWVSWSAYIAACTMAFLSTTVAAKFSNA